MGIAAPSEVAGFLWSHGRERLVQVRHASFALHLIVIILIMITLIVDVSVTIIINIDEQRLLYPSPVGKQRLLLLLTT